VPQALEEAARGLRDDLGYGRVILGVVDPARQLMLPIAMEFVEGDYPLLTIRRMAFRLDSNETSGSQWVVKTKKALVSRHALYDPRVRKSVAQNLRIKAVAIVPLLDSRGEVVGTVHVERRDGLAPTDDEAQDLIELGRWLAIVIGVSEQLQMLQSGLDALYDTIILFDRAKTPRYVNPRAGRRLNLRPGWYAVGEGPTYEQLKLRSPDLSEGEAAPIAAHASPIIRTGNPLSAAVPGGLVSVVERPVTPS
jgi:GAF domain-containing protein